jgi:hypothetical protein
MLPLIALLIVGGMYLAVNAQRAQAGREVLVLQGQQAELSRQNAELSATYAELTTPDRMFERALELGYKPGDPQEVEYILIEDYTGPSPFVAPKPPASMDIGDVMPSPAYSETLGQRFLRWLGWQEGGSQ